MAPTLRIADTDVAIVPKESTTIDARERLRIRKRVASVFVVFWEGAVDQFQACFSSCREAQRGAPDRDVHSYRNGACVLGTWVRASFRCLCGREASYRTGH